jgi:hypothetical protein
MRLSGTVGLLGAGLIMACASVQPTIVPEPVNEPGANAAQPAPTAPTVPTAAPTSSVPVPRSGSWTFAYVPGTYAYTVTTNAIVEPVTDTTQKRQIPASNQTATIAISAAGDVEVVNPVAVTSASCDSNAAITARAQQLIPKLPSHLVAGDRWRDSTTTTGCRGMIPAESKVISDYVVIGDTSFANVPAVQIHRTDLLSVNGEGTEGQHRIFVTATGTGVADLFFNIAAGQFVGSRSLQTTLVNVTTSGRSTRFIQHVTESVAVSELR